MTHYMNLHFDPFSKIKNKTKTIELRLYDEKRSLINVNDTIVFSCTSDPAKTVTVKVSALHRFKNFAELYKTLPLERCGYLPHEIPNATPEDMNVYYSIEKQKQYGVVGIEIRLI